MIFCGRLSEDSLFFCAALANYYGNAESAVPIRKKLGVQLVGMNFQTRSGKHLSDPMIKSKRKKESQ